MSDTESIEFINANSAAPSLTQKTASELNVFVGNEPARWRTHLPLQQRVQYRAIYRGIDVVYHGEAQQLEYDFEVAPGADASQILLGFPRGARLDVNAVGDLAISTGGSTVLQHLPRAYQGSRMVAAHYAIDRRHRQVRIVLGRYDRTRGLTIDPVLAYGALAAGAGQAIAADAEGNAYILGNAPAVAPGSPAFFVSGSGGYHLLLLKVDPTGAQLLYAVILGGTASEFPGGVAVDRDGAAYLTGDTRSVDFPVTSQAFQSSLPCVGSEDLGPNSAFVTKISADGSSIVYSTYLGGSGYSQGNAIAVDEHGNAFVAGFTSPPDFPLTTVAYLSAFGIYPPENGNAYTPGFISGGFVTKLNTTGSAPVYSTLVETNPMSITVDDSGAVYVAGSPLAYLPPLTLAVGDRNSGGTIVAKINPSGSAADFTVFLGCMMEALEPLGIVALDSKRNVVVAGTTTCGSFPGSSSGFQPQHASGSNLDQGAYDGLIVKIAADGSALLTATFLGGGKLDEISGIKVASDDSVLVTGGTSSRDFPVTPDALQPTYGGGDIPQVAYRAGDGFFSHLSPNLDQMLYSTYLGGSGADVILALSLDLANNAYLVGTYGSLNSPRTANTFSFSGPGSLWALKISNDASLPPALLSASPSSTTVGSNDLPIQLIGSNFASNAELLMNGSPRPTAVDSASQLEATLPAADLASTRPLELRVLNPNSGASNALIFPVNAADGSNPNPRITTLLPSSVTAGSGAQNILVRGSGFLASSVVSINGNARTTVANSDTEISVLLTADDLSSPATLSFTAANPGPGGGMSNPAHFQVLGLTTTLPALSDVTPSLFFAGTSDTKVTISGSGFTRSTVARWNGVDHPISFDSSGHPTFIASAADLAGAGTAEVTVYNPANGLESNPLPIWVALKISGNDMVYSAGTHRSYISISNSSSDSSAGNSATNSIALVNPGTGSIEATVSMDLTPSRLAVSSDGGYLFVYLMPGRGLRRYRLLSAEPWLTEPLNLPVSGVWDLAPVPGHPKAIAVAYTSPTFAAQVAIFDDAVARPSMVQVSFTGSLLFSEDGQTLYVAAGFSSLAVTTISVTDGGLGTPVTRGQTNNNGQPPLRYLRGRFYSSSGNVFDAATLALVGRLPASSNAPLLVTPQSVILLTGSQYYCALDAFDPMTLASLWETHVNAGCQSDSSPFSAPVDIGGRIAFRTNGLYLVQEPAPAPSYSISTLEPTFTRTFELGTSGTPDNQLVALCGQNVVQATAMLSSAAPNSFSLAFSQGLSTPGAFVFAPISGTIEVGEYTGTVSILLSNSTNPPLVVPYDISVVNPYPLQASIDSLTFNYQIGGLVPSSQSFALAKKGKTAAVNLQAGSQNWLSVSYSGIGAPETITVSVNPIGLSAATYKTTLVFGYYSPYNSTVQIPVTLQVQP
ncbi:MAG TPA: SBBP repeat-containing protein [Bryobacteraceae bacterium]